MKLVNYECNSSAIHNAVFVLMWILVLPTHSVIAQQLLWQRVFDTGVSELAKGIAVDSWGNIIVTGRSSREASGGDCLTIKYNPNGDTIWTRWYDSTFYDGANAVAVDGSGNVIIAGDIRTDSTNADIHIVKYDPNGNILWTRTYSNGEKDVGEFGYGVAVDSKDNIIVTGQAYYNWGDYITIKYDSSGNLLWVRTYDGGWEDCAQDVAVDDSNNVIVTGYSNGDMNWDWCTIKYNLYGDKIWVRRHDIGLDDKADGVTCDKDGNVVVVGRLGQSPEKYASIVKYSAAGDTLWIKLFPRIDTLDGLMNFTDVAADGYGNIYTAGLFVLWDSGKDWRDYYIAKFNPQGDTLWTTLCDINWKDEPSGIALDSVDNIIVTGTTRADLFGFDYFTVKLHNAINGVSEENVAPRCFFLHHNYPNPFNAATTIAYDVPYSASINIKVYDLLGRELSILVDEYKHPGSYHTVWDASRFASGVYVVQLVTGRFFARQKLMLAK